MDPLPWYRVAAPFAALFGLAIVAQVRPELRIRSTLYGALAMAAYAALQDQLSARLCPEYFTVFHNPIPGVTDPTVLGLLWGVLGAWWGGAAMGYALGVAATIGTKPALDMRDLVRPAAGVLLATAFVSLVCGASVWRHFAFFGIKLDPSIAEFVPESRHRELVTVACYHFAGYVAAAVGSVLACAAVGRERSRRAAALPPGV